MYLQYLDQLFPPAAKCASSSKSTVGAQSELSPLYALFHRSMFRLSKLTLSRLRVSTHLRRRKGSRARSQPTIDTRTVYSYIENRPVCLGVVEPPICVGVVESPTSDDSLPLCLEAEPRPPEYNTLFAQTASVAARPDRLRQPHIPGISLRAQSVQTEAYVAQPKTSLRSRYRRSIEILKHHTPSWSKRRYNRPSEEVPPCNLPAKATPELPGSMPYTPSSEICELPAYPMEFIENGFLDVPVREQKSKTSACGRLGPRALAPLYTPQFVARLSEEDLLAPPSMTYQSLSSSPISPETPNSTTTQYASTAGHPNVSPITVASRQIASAPLERQLGSNARTYRVHEDAHVWDGQSQISSTTSDPMEMLWDGCSTHQQQTNLSPIQDSYTQMARQRVRLLSNNSPILKEAPANTGTDWSEMHGWQSKGDRSCTSKWHRKLCQSNYASGSAPVQHSSHLYNAIQVNNATAASELRQYAPASRPVFGQKATTTAKRANGQDRARWPEVFCPDCGKEFTGR